MASAHVTNVGRVRPLPVGNAVIGTAIDKHAVDDGVQVDANGLVLDVQAHREIHGGSERALYAFALRAGDEITVVARPAHDVTVSDTHRIYRRTGRGRAPGGPAGPRVEPRRVGRRARSAATA